MIYYLNNKAKKKLRMDVINLGVKKDCINEAVDTIMKILPDYDRDQIESIVTRKFKERLSNPAVTMDNNVTGMNKEIKLTDLCNWIDRTKPVISGNATFYMQPKVLKSPTSEMLRSLKRGRKEIKKKMFQYKATDDEYKRLDLAQLNAKVIMNAEYGASGAPTAAFYTKYSPAATTLLAQSIITVMAAFFEGYVGDNQKFYHINECVDWMNTIVKKKKDYDIFNWVVIPTYEETSNRIKSHFIAYNRSYDFVIDEYLKHCTAKELAYIYYANNIKEFIRRHKKVSNLIKNVLSTIPTYEAVMEDHEIPPRFRDKFRTAEKYNDWIAEVMFLNPYNIPESVKKYMNELTIILNKYCFIEYITPDSIVKLNNHKRNTVLLVDTDSNVIHADIFVSFVLDELFPNETFSRDRLYNDMICVSMLASIIDSCIINMLDFYGRCHNMDEESRKELVMKNEFMFRIFFLMLKKKRYAASILLREGHIMIPFKLEIKGVDFIKAGVTEDVTKRFTEIIRDNILFSNQLDVHGMMRELKRFEKEIYNDLRSGGVRFLKPQMYKSEGAYKTRYDKKSGNTVSGAWSLPVFRAAAIWNELYPNQKIYTMDRVKMIKLIVTSPSDLKKIEQKYPDEYKLVMDKIFNSHNPDIAKAGLKVIALPSTVGQIPKWIIELIDYDVVISDVMSSFKSIINAFRSEIINIKTPNGKANMISSLISI